jgi:signal peptidase I
MSGGWWDDDNPQDDEETAAPEAREAEQPENAPEPVFPEWPVYQTSDRPSTTEDPAGVVDERQRERRTRDPLARLFPGLPRRARVTLDWVLTIAGAVLIVLALKAWVVNPYRIPSSSMEPALKCASPGQGCTGDSSDRVLACRICLDFSGPSRGDVVVFNTPNRAKNECGEKGTFVKRVIGLPGETVRENRHGFILIRGPDSKVWEKLKEPYISKRARELDTEHFSREWHVPKDSYFMMGDNRSESCDSRAWGSVRRGDLIGTVFFIYWPPDRIGFLGAVFALLALPFAVGRRPNFL